MGSICRRPDTFVHDFLFHLCRGSAALCFGGGLPGYCLGLLRPCPCGRTNRGSCVKPRCGRIVPLLCIACDGAFLSCRSPLCVEKEISPLAGLGSACEWRCAASFFLAIACKF